MEALLSYEDVLSADSPLDFASIGKARQTREEVKEVMAPSAEAEVTLKDPETRAFPIKIPQRFTVEDYEVLVPPGATVDWLRLLSTHRKTLLQLERRAAYLIFPDKFNRAQQRGAAFAWLLPPL